jgi:hypothetical protein
MLESMADPERVRCMSQRDHAQAAKVAHEIASLLDGQPTSRTERTGDDSANSRAADLLRDLGGLAKPIRAEEVRPHREARAGELVAGGALVAPLAVGCRDLQSRDSVEQVAQ